MNIKRLPPDIISKIAAGEVVDRPASVVKELLENALDAGATRIELNLKEAGKSLIHIKDNGCGIHHDDLEVAFERHATSKIQSADDLFDIHSLGFRGEALYSIAAVADVVLRSRTPKDDSGWEIHMRGGEKLSLQPVMASQGTDIQIQELFFNTPARRKFLKATAAELTQILNLVMPYTLLFPSVGFDVTHQGRKLLSLSPTESLIDRVATALNLDNGHLIKAKQEFADGVTISVVLGDMNIRRSKRDMQFLFVNQRPVISASLAFHLNDIYKLVLPPDVYGFFAVNISVPPDTIDVNIHPTKREVRIKDEYRIAQMLRSMCEHALMTEGKMKQVTAPFPSSQPTAFKGVQETAHRPYTPVPRDSSLTEGIPTTKMIFGPQHTESSRAQFTPPTLMRPPSTPHIEAHEPLRLFENAGGESLPEKFRRARYIGSFIHKFLLFEVDHSILLVDQHAAQERIMYERFRNQIETGDVEVQNLLTPVVLKLTPQEMLDWEEAKDVLKKAGLDTTLFGRNTIAVHTHPTFIKDIEQALRILLSGEKLNKWDHDTIARRACRASIMSGDPMSTTQAEHQRQELLCCQDAFTCPHGRPTVIELTEYFLDKQFLRT